MPRRRQLTQLLIGLVAAGLGIALVVRSDLGLGPWDVLHQGIAERTGISMGMVVIGVGVVVLAMWVPLRQPLGLGTVLNVLVVGSALDLFLDVLPEVGNLVARWVALGGGVVAVGVGSGLYLGAGMGPGPRDGVMTGLARRGTPVWVARTGIEVSALVVGWLLGGTAGIGTLVFALAIGPLVQLFLEPCRLAVPAEAPVARASLAAGTGSSPAPAAALSSGTARP